MPAASTGNMTVASGQTLSAIDMIIAATGSVFGNPVTNLVRTTTRVAVPNLRSLFFYVYHYPFYATGSATVVGATAPARMGCSWRPVFIAAPTIRQDVSGASGAGVAVPPAGTFPATYEPFNPWIPLVPPQLCPPGVPSYITLDCGGAVLVAIELDVPVVVAGGDRFRLIISAAE